MKTYVMKISTLSALVLLLTSSVEAIDPPHWDHDNGLASGNQGPDGTYWGIIKSEKATANDAGLYGDMKLVYAECAVGSHQSPIAINLTANPIPLTLNPITHSSDKNPPAEPERRADSLVVRYAPSTSSTEGAAIGTDQGNAYVFRNSGHAVQVSFSKGYPGRLAIGKDVYPLVQFHFHTPSEHIVVTDQFPAGKSYQGELHFVHQRDDGRLAVLGVFLDASKDYPENPILKKIIDNTPSKHDTYNQGQTTAGLFLDPSHLIPAENEHVFTYAGSLTTPPCSEGVSWYVMSEPLKVNGNQIDALQAKLGEANNRIVQNTNARTVEIRKDLHVDQGYGY